MKKMLHQKRKHAHLFMKILSGGDPMREHAFCVLNYSFNKYNGPHFFQSLLGLVDITETVYCIFYTLNK